jgi:hypothetical protein
MRLIAIAACTPRDRQKVFSPVDAAEILAHSDETEAD